MAKRKHLLKWLAPWFQWFCIRYQSVSVYIDVVFDVYRYNSIRAPEREKRDSDTRAFLHAAHATAAWYWAVVNAQRKMLIYLFSLWLRKASSHVLCLSNLVKRLEQDTWMCQELFQCWVQNWADLLLVSTPSLTPTVSVFFLEMGWVTVLKLVRPSKSSPYFNKWFGYGVEPRAHSWDIC